MHVCSTPFWKKTLFLGATLHFHILPSILVYADGSKFQSVNTKTSQFSPFFWLARVWEKHVNTKSLRKKHGQHQN